jgi:CBS domain-containing protein
MSNTVSLNAPPGVRLQAHTAAELMNPNPVSLREMATVAEAVELLADRGISAAPVIDRAGRPVGVLSRTDILAHDRENVEYLAPVSEGEAAGGAGMAELRVRDLMTPVVFSVPPEAPAASVVEQMLALKVHRLFVVDRAGVLVGVISALDVLRHLGE